MSDRRPASAPPLGSWIAAGLVLAILGFVGSWAIGSRIHPVVFEYGNGTPGQPGMRTNNIWFDGDLPSMNVMLNDRSADRGAFTAKHPLHRLGLYTVGFVLKQVVAPRTLHLVVAATGAAVWSLMLFTVVSLITVRRLDAMLFSLLAMSSASALFWLGVPETYGWGSATILAAVGIVAASKPGPISPLWFVVVSAATLSVTVTNWMFGLLATFLAQPLRKAVVLTLCAFLAVCVVWGVERTVIPTTRFFVGLGSEEHKFILSANSGGPAHVVRSFLFHGMVMPEIEIRRETNPTWWGMATQSSRVGSGSSVGPIAIILWTALLALGCFALVTVPRLRLVGALVMLGIGLQLCLHLLYGHETFLYSLHYVPLLIVVAAMGTQTRFRIASLVLATCLLIVGGVNNTIQLGKATGTTHEIAALDEKERGAEVQSR